MTVRGSDFLTRDDFIVALTKLGARLEARGIVGDVYLVGGAAMVLAYQFRELTRDIDAVFVPSAEIYQAAREVQDELDLPDGWLNDAAKGYVPGDDHNAVPVMTVPGLSVTAASPEFMLGMKLLAARPDQDRDDIAYLAKLLNLGTSDQVLQVVERLYPPDLLTPRTKFLVQEMFPQSLDVPVNGEAPADPAGRRPPQNDDLGVT
ncbi:MAG: hypothetical protein WA751_04330 [Candidatus Dormiibacterota bacterium]